MGESFESRIAAAEAAHDIPFSIQEGRTQFNVSKVELEASVDAIAKFKTKGVLSFDLTKANTLLFKSESLEWDITAQKSFKSDETLTFRTQAFEAKGYVSSFGSDKDYEFRLYDLRYQKTFSTKSIFYLVPNSRLQGTDYIKNERRIYTGRIKNSSGNYEILVDKLSDKEKKDDQEQVSHIVEFRKTKSSFDLQEIEDLAYKLQAIFSFIDGHWLSPILAYYYEDGSPEIVWLNSGIRWTPPQKIHNWYFDALRTTDPKFISKSLEFMSQDYNLSLWQHCLTWYFEALEGDMKKSILSNHIALEMLSWAIVIEMKTRLSENGFDILPAADKINLLILCVGISNEIPIELTG